jgi:dihydrofolate synthase/folylpolyglutamate synthase
LTLDKQLARLSELGRRGARLGLDRIEEALGFCDDPQEGLACVHIAGTNGKGSVSAMVERIARSAGLKTGLYTSPHLCRFNERIAIGGEPIADDFFASVLERAMHAELPPLSLFETMTVAAFLAFARAGCDLVVLEVGMGGRLDATNVVLDPQCAAITSIGRDHQRFLGDDLASIAREKAAIAKPGRPLVVGPLAPEAAVATASVARDIGASPVAWIDPPDALPLADDAQRSYIELDQPPFPGASIRFDASSRVTLRPQLPGAHQLANAAVAAAIAWQLRASHVALWAHVEQGVAEARWPGRLELLAAGAARVLLDCAHNLEGIDTLCNHLRRAYSTEVEHQRVLLLFGAIDDKPHAAMIDAIAPLCARRHYCRPIDPIAGRRAVDPDALALAWPGRSHQRPETALAAALSEAGDGDLVVVTGSIFLVGAVRAELLGLERHAPIPF